MINFAIDLILKLRNTIMGGICCPERTDLHSTSEPPLDHKSALYATEEDVKQDEEAIKDLRLKMAGGMGSMFAQINKQKKDEKTLNDLLNRVKIRKQVNLFKKRLKEDILAGRWTVRKPIEDLPLGVLGTFEDLNDEVGAAYYSQFTQEVLEYSLSVVDGNAMFGDYTDLQDDWFNLYLHSIAHSLELVEYCRDCDEE